MSKIINPIQDIFLDIEKIISFMVVKNKIEAEKYETMETAKESALWITAIMQQDTYLTYHDLYTHAMFQEITPNIRYQIVEDWLRNIYNVPLIYRDHLLKTGRKIVIDRYVEGNNYYRMLNGQPPIEATEADYIYLSDTLKQLYGVSDNIPIHKLSDTIQNKYLLTDEYKTVLMNNPNKEYLRYIGLYRIDIFVARRARDFQLVRYLPMDRSDINPYLMKEFASLYNKYRDYIITTVYNEEYVDLFVNYREFMSLMIISFVLMQICNKAVEHTSDKRFLDDNIIQTIFQMYGIPRSLIMTQEVKRRLVVALNKLIQEKSTNPVFYDLIKILNYDDVVISKFMLMKQQQFDHGQAMFSDGTPINTPEDMDLLVTIDPETGKPHKSLSTDIYFQAVDLKSDNPYHDIVTMKTKSFGYSEITEPDPRWWELPDTQNLIQNKYYTNADSKYIMIESVINQTTALFESIYFMRMLLDNKDFTDTFMLTVPEVFGNTNISLFDLAIFLVAAMCENSNLTGEIITTASGLLAIAGFNFDLDLDLFKEFLNTTKYVDREKLLRFISNLSMRNPSDINRLFNEMMLPLKDWLTYEMSQTQNRTQFNEYEKIYRSLFVYDAVRSVFVESFVPPISRIKLEYKLSNSDWLAFSLFYPHTAAGETLTIDMMDQYPDYFPFLGNSVGESKTWYVSTPRGDKVYFYDIMNREDLRYKTDINGNTIKDPIWWNVDVIDNSVVQSVIGNINALSDSELNNSYFKVRTFIPGTNQVYEAGDRLPVIIRNEIFKNLLISKIQMDMSGEAQPARTYKEYIARKNPKLYSLFSKAEYAHDDWMNDMMNIVVAIENSLNMHMKYFEQSVVGPDMFFKPLITLIKYFKSHMVDFARSGLRYIFSDKIDTGGNSNMLKMFDEIGKLIYHIILAGRGEKAEFGLYDAKNKMKYNLIMNDASEIIQTTARNDSGKIINLRKYYMGSTRLVDECKFFKNGKDIDPSGQPSNWYPGESGVGRFVDDADHTDAAYVETSRIQSVPVDTEGWKEFVESYNPQSN